jgi:Tfp pilus assembly protein PilE
MKNFKGQSSIEFVSVVAITALLASPFIIQAQQSVFETRSSTELSQFGSSLDEFVNAVERVDVMGEPARDSARLNIPNGVIRAKVVNQNALVYTSNASGTLTNYSRIVDAKLEETDLPTEEGSYLATLEASSGQVNISFENWSPYSRDFFRPSISSVDSPVVEVEQFNASYVIENLAQSPGDQQVSARVENSTYSDTVRTENLQLDGGETDSTDIQWSSSGKASGDYEFIVETENETVKEDFEVVSPGPAVFDVSNIQASPDPVTEGENVTVTADVENTGETDGSKEVRLVIKGSQEGSDTLNLDKDETRQIEFNYTTSSSDRPIIEAEIETDDSAVFTEVAVERAFTANGLHAHWDMSDLAYSNGETVSSVSDQSGNGYDLSNSGSGPVMVESGLNGNDLVEFQGNSRLDSPEWSPVSEPYTIFFVTSSYDSPSDGVTMDSAGGSGRAFIARDNPEWRIWNGGGFNTAFTGDEQEHIITAVYSDSNGKFRYDGSEETGNSGSNDITSIRLGQDNTGARALEGRVGEVIMYNRSLSSSEITEVESYLSGKWGITLS